MQSRKKLTTLVLPAFLALIALFFAACGGGATNPSGQTKAPASQQVFTFPEEGIADIATFDPAITTDLNSAQALYLVFTGMVQLNDQLQIQPQLASSWSTSTDGMTYTFHLRPNLHFSDGTPLTSQDVIYSINRSIDPATKSTVGPYYLALIKDSTNFGTGPGKVKTLIGDSLLAPDATTVVIKITKPAAYFLDALTYPTSFVVEKSLITQYGTSWTDHLTLGGGDGPFKVSAYNHSKEIDFVPNPNYYGPKPQLQKVVYPFYKQADTAYRAYQVNQVSIASVPTTDIPAAKALPNGQFHQAPTLNIWYYAMNYLVKPFDNIQIRQAFELALNKDLIATNVYKGSVIASNHIVPKGMPGYNPNLTGPDGVTGTSGDVTKAKSLLQTGMAAEGYTSISQMPAITLVYPSGSTDLDNEMAAVTQMWQSNLGISVKLAPTDFNKELDETTAAVNNPKGLQMWAIGWIADYPDPQDWTSLQFCNGCGQNGMNYGQNKTSNAATQQQIQKQLLQADSMPNGATRYQAYNTAEQQLVNDVAWLPVYQATVSVVIKPYVQGDVLGAFVNSELLTPPNDWGNIYIATH